MCNWSRSGLPSSALLCQELHGCRINVVIGQVYGVIRIAVHSRSTTIESAEVVLVVPCRAAFLWRSTLGLKRPACGWTQL